MRSICLKRSHQLLSSNKLFVIPSQNRFSVIIVQLIDLLKYYGLNVFLSEVTAVQDTGTRNFWLENRLISVRYSNYSAAGSGRT